MEFGVVECRGARENEMSWALRENGIGQQLRAFWYCNFRGVQGRQLDNPTL